MKYSTKEGISYESNYEYEDWYEENRLQVPREFMQHFRRDGRSDRNSKEGAHENAEHSHILHGLSTERCDQASCHGAK
jgi:hypothetical protein